MPYWRAFTVLSTSRESGMGMGHIPYSEIICYINEHRIKNIDDRNTFVNFVQYIDDNFVKLKTPKSTK